MTIFNATDGLSFATVTAAINASSSGDVLLIPAGLYVEEFPLITHSLTLQGVGGMAQLRTPNPLPANDRAVLFVQGNAGADLTVRNLEIFGAARPSFTNGAGILFEVGNGNLRVYDSWFHHNENGILVGDGATTTVEIVRSEFSFNGNPVDQPVVSFAHNLYVNKVAQLTVTDSYFHDVRSNHELKSRAMATTITNTRFVDGPASQASYNVDLPNGGVARLEGNQFLKGALAPNRYIVHYGGEMVPTWPGSRLDMSGNLIVNQRAAGATGIFNESRDGPSGFANTASITNNTFYNVSVMEQTAFGPSVQTLTGNVMNTGAAPPISSAVPWSQGLAGLTVAQALAAFAGNTLADGTYIADNARQFAEFFDDLLPLAAAGKLAGVVITNGGRPQVVLTPAQLAAGNSLLGLVSGPFSLQQRIAAADAATATLAPGFTALSVWDTAANIQANLPAIEALWRQGTLGFVRFATGSPTAFSLSAAQVAANIDALRAIGSPFTIALTDPGTPTLTLPVWADAEANYGWVIASITTPFTLELDGPLRANRVASILSGVTRSTSGEISVPLNSIAPLGGTSTAHLPSNLTVLDYHGRISSFIEALQAAAASGKLTSIVMRDGGVQVLSLTPAQLTANAQAVALFSPNVQLSQVITAAEAALPFRDARFPNFTVEDSVANVVANADAVEALAKAGMLAKLRFTETTANITLTANELSRLAVAFGFAFEDVQSIRLTDAGTPTLVLAAEAIENASTRGNAINAIAGPVSISTTGRISAGAAASILSENGKTLASLAPGALRIADFTSNVVSNLAALRQLADRGVVTEIELINGGVQGLGISSGSATTNASALALITTPHSTAAAPIKNPVSSSAAGMVALFATLEATARDNELGPITLTDGGTPNIVLTMAQFTQNLEVLAEIVGPYTITVTDSSTVPLQAWQIVSGIETVFERTSFPAPITLVLDGPVSAGVAAFLAANIGGPTSFSPGLQVADFASNVAANIAALQTLAVAGRLGSIQLIDNGGFGRVVLTPSQAAAAPEALARITSPHYLVKSVTAAQAALATIPDGGFDSLQVVDTLANVAANLAALQALAVAGKVNGVSFSGGSTLNLTAAQVAANAEILTRLGTTYTITLTDVGTPAITLQGWQISSNIATNLLSRISSNYTLQIEGPIRPNRVTTLVNAGAGIYNRIAAGSLWVRDYPTNFDGRMDDLAVLVAAGKVGTIDTRGGRPVLSMTAADATTFAGVLTAMNTPYTLSQKVTIAGIAGATLAPGFRDYTVEDSVANVLAGLSQVQGLAAAGQLGRLSFTDTAPRLSLSAAQLAAGLDAFATLDENGYPIELTDIGTPTLTVPGYLLGDYYIRNNVLESIATPWSLVVSGRVTVNTAAAIAAENNRVRSHLATPLTVAGFSFDIAPDFDYLLAMQQAGKLAVLDIIDTGAPTFVLTDAKATALAGLFALTTDPYLVQTESGTRATTTLGELGRVAITEFSGGVRVAVGDLNFTPSRITYSYDGTTLQLLRDAAPIGSFGATAPVGLTYTAKSFYIEPSGTTGTQIRVSHAPIAVLDTVTSDSIITGGEFTNGTVPYLQRDFINPTGHSVNVSANIPNVFLHGGFSGGNALQVLSGNNVVDGGLGSNFLVGGVGQGPQNEDVFFLDGRGGGVSWGTLMNFNPGDAVTFWGWKQGVTTFEWAANDGAPGFTGATIHARLNGGTEGVFDASITFRGIDLATAQSWTIEENTLGGINTYAYIKYPYPS